MYIFMCSHMCLRFSFSDLDIVSCVQSVLHESRRQTFFVFSLPSFPCDVTDGAAVSKTVLATWLTEAAWLLSKTKTMAE